MKPPSVYDYPVWDGAANCYAVFVGTAGGVINPIVYITNRELKMVANGSFEVFGYADGGKISRSPLDGTWLDAERYIIEEAGLELVAGSHMEQTDFDVSLIDYRIMKM